MRGKKLCVFTALLVLLGGLSGCGKIRPTDQTIAPDKVSDATNVRLETGPSEVKSAVLKTKTGQKSNIILNNGQNGDVVLSKNEGTTGEIVKIFVRPDYGYEPDKVLFNGMEIAGTKGNYQFQLVDGENKIDVSYKNIKPILTTPSASYNQEFNFVKTKCDDQGLIYDDTDEKNKYIGVNNKSVAYNENYYMQFINSMSTLVLDENNETGKFSFTSIIGSTTLFQFETIIDAKTFNEKTKYEDLDVKVTLLKPATPNASIEDFKKDYQQVFIESIDGLLKRFSSSQFIYNIDLYNLGFYHYPGRFEVEYVPDEFINENTSIKYATQIADIRNSARNKYNVDNFFIDFKMNGIIDSIKLDKLGDLNSAFIFIYKDKIRFLYESFALEEYSYENILFMSIDVPNDGGEKVQLKGFANLISNRESKETKIESINTNYEIILDKTLSISDVKFNLTNSDVCPIYFDSKGIEHKNDFILSTKELNILNNRLMHAFRVACINFVMDKNGYDFVALKIVKEFTKEEALKYNVLNASLANSKEIYKKWHQDLNKLIRSFDNKDETTTDLVEVKLKDIKLNPNVIFEIKDANNELPNIILRSENNRIQFGLEYKKNTRNLYNTSLITLPDENQSSFVIDQVIRLTNDSGDANYYHRTVNLKTWISWEKTDDTFKCYESSSINNDLTLKPDAVEVKPTIVHGNSKAYSSNLLDSIFKCLFNGFADYSVYLSFGFDSCETNYYFTGDVDL